MSKITISSVRYDVLFEMPDPYNVIAKCWVTLPEGKGVGDVKDGFWVDDEVEFTQGSANSWWVAPARIIGIKKRYVKTTHSR